MGLLRVGLVDNYINKKRAGMNPAFLFVRGLLLYNISWLQKQPPSMSKEKS
ncbi:hypothetical protein BSSX_p0055 (plasmid) [Bacillus subtilis]|nr:hypothetical protein BSSX_p0055 [Bacillus subtilis]